MAEMFEGMRNVVDPIVMEVGREGPGSQLALAFVGFALFVLAIMSVALLARHMTGK
jgi:hypothetical protein